MNHRLRILLYFASIFCFLLACSSDAQQEIPEQVKELENVTIYEQNASPSSEVTLTEQVRYTDNEADAVTFGQLTAVEVDTAGKVYIGEGSRAHLGIYVFDSEGGFIKKIGQTGRGPGEFQSLLDFTVGGDKIVTLDGTEMRVQVFSTQDYSLVHEANLDPSQWEISGERAMSFPAQIHILSDSTLLGVFNNINFDLDTRSFYKLDMDGNTISDRLLTYNYIKHLETDDDTRTFYDPFGGRGVATISTDNNIYSAWSEDMLFKVYDTDGTYIRSFYYPFNNSSISREEALGYYQDEAFKNALQNEGIPKQWRAFEHLIIDDEDNFWVSTIIAEEKYEWWVMDNSGNLKATFRWPGTKEIKEVKYGFAYVLEMDEQTGLQEVVKYRVEWQN